MIQLLREAKDLHAFKRLVDIFANFVSDNPGTGMMKIYRKLLSAGLKSMPKDKKAQQIINYVTMCGSPAKVIQDVLNTDFSELPLNLRPIYKNRNSRLIAFWNKNGRIYQRVFDLLSLNGEPGFWCAENGEKVDLYDFNKEQGE